MSSNRKGIELIRYATHMLSSCNETFNMRYTAEQLLRIADAVQKCGWDFYPDQWTEQQVQDCIQFGIVPDWKEENGRYVPVYKQTGDKVFKIAGEHISTFEVEVTANTLEEAIKWAEGDMPTPKDTEYLDDSFQVNEEVTRELNHESEKDSGE